MLRVLDPFRDAFRAQSVLRATSGAARAWIFAAVLTLPVAGAAQNKAKFELDWEAPAGCMTEEQARAAIEGLLSENTSARDEPAQVEVSIEATDDQQLKAEIVVQHANAEGERAVTGASCARLSEAAALIVAMVLDPVGASQRILAQPPAEPPRDDARDVPSEPIRLALGLRLSGDFGALPNPTGGAGLALGLHVPFLGTVLRTQLEALAWLPQDAQSGPVPGSGATIGLYTGALRGCLDLATAGSLQLAVGICLAAEAGLSTGSARGISDGRADHGLWSAGLAGLFLRRALASSLLLELMAEVGAPLHRPSYGIDGFGPIFRASPVTARFSLGIGWLFP